MMQPESDAFTLDWVSSKNMGVGVKEQDEAFNFSSDLSDTDKGDMKDRLEALQSNKDQWGEPILITYMEIDGEYKLLEYSVSDSDIPDDFEPVEDDDGYGSDGARMSGVAKEQAIKILHNQADRSSVETHVVSNGDEPEDKVVHATVMVDGNEYDALATADDSESNTQLLETAETRAVKRAIVFSGILIDHVEGVDGD